MDFELIAQQIVTAVRRDRNSRLLSHRLGFVGNQIQRWENGTRKIHWSDFTRYCKHCNAPIDEAVKRGLILDLPTHDGAKIAQQLMGGGLQSEISRTTGISRHTIHRWIHKGSDPLLADILRLMHHCQFILFEFLQFIVDLDAIDELADENQMRKKRKELYFRFPIAPAVLCCLQLDEYSEFAAHEFGFVSRKLEISIEEETRVLAALQEAGKIQLVEGKFIVLNEQLELTDSEQIRRFVAYWFEKTADLLKVETNPFAMFGAGMDVFTTDKATAAKIKEEYRDFYRRVRSLLANSSGSQDGILLFNSSLMDLNRILIEPSPRQGFRIPTKERLPEHRHLGQTD